MFTKVFTKHEGKKRMGPLCRKILLKNYIFSNETLPTAKISNLVTNLNY